MTGTQDANTSDPRRVSRRSFLKVSGAALGGMTLACSGLGYLASRAPECDLANTNCGGDNMNDGKTLVAYATRAGSTVEIAEAIGATLCENGAAVDVRPIKEVESLDGYRAVVLGSAIRMGRWLPEAVQFVETHKDQLAELPHAYFLASLFLSQDTPGIRDTVRAYLDPVREILDAERIGLFTGKMDYSKLSWFDRQAAKFVKASEGDHRDWDEIRAWAHELSVAGFAA